MRTLKFLFLVTLCGFYLRLSVGYPIDDPFDAQVLRGSQLDGVDIRNGLSGNLPSPSSDEMLETYNSIPYDNGRILEPDIHNDEFQSAFSVSFSRGKGTNNVHGQLRDLLVPQDLVTPPIHTNKRQQGWHIQYGKRSDLDLLNNKDGRRELRYKLLLQILPTLQDKTHDQSFENLLQSLDKHLIKTNKRFQGWLTAYGKRNGNFNMEDLDQNSLIRNQKRQQGWWTPYGKRSTFATLTEDTPHREDRELMNSKRQQSPIAQPWHIPYRERSQDFEFENTNILKEPIRNTKRQQGWFINYGKRSLDSSDSFRNPSTTLDDSDNIRNAKRQQGWHIQYGKRSSNGGFPENMKELPIENSKRQQAWWTPYGKRSSTGDLGQGQALPDVQEYQINSDDLEGRWPEYYGDLSTSANENEEFETSEAEAELSQSEWGQHSIESLQEKVRELEKLQIQNGKRQEENIPVWPK